MVVAGTLRLIASVVVMMAVAAGAVAQDAVPLTLAEAAKMTLGQ